MDSVKRCMELEQKIKLLEYENSIMLEQTEEIELMASISDTIVDMVSKEDVYSDVLEKISILKDIPICAVAEIENDTLKISLPGRKKISFKKVR